MARIIHGDSNLKLQPGWEVEEDYNGLLTAQCVWEGDALYEALVPAIESQHPRDGRLFCHKRKITHLAAGKIRGTLQYIGIAADPTIPVVEFPGGSGQDPIETHENFAEFAGTPSSPKNGAIFDENSGDFVGFQGDSEFAGTRAYIVPSVIVNVTYYTHRVPNSRNIGRIVSGNMPNFTKPSSVKNFLIIGQPYRQIANLYAVTQQFLGSGPKGWNTLIY